MKFERKGIMGMNNTIACEKSIAKKINCDVVAWLTAILQRYEEAIKSSIHNPSISRMDKAAKLAALLEIMDILNWEFEDDLASGNALSGFTEFNKLRNL